MCHNISTKYFFKEHHIGMVMVSIMTHRNMEERKVDQSALKGTKMRESESSFTLHSTSAGHRVAD